MKITKIKRKDGWNHYTIEAYTGTLRFSTFSKWKTAAMSAGWWSFIISRSEIAKQLRTYRQYKREGRLA